MPSDGPTAAVDRVEAVWWVFAVMLAAGSATALTLQSGNLVVGGIVAILVLVPGLIAGWTA